MLKHVHDLSFSNAGDNIVDHCSAHNLVDALYSSWQCAAVNEIIYVRLFLFFSLVVNSDKLQFGLVPAVGRRRIAEENFTISGFLNILNLKLATDIR